MVGGHEMMLILIKTLRSPYPILYSVEFIDLVGGPSLSKKLSSKSFCIMFDSQEYDKVHYYVEVHSLDDYTSVSLSLLSLYSLI